MTTSVLETLVGDGKKYSSVEALAESRIKADEYIDKLKGDLAALQAQVGSGNPSTNDALEKILSELKNSNQNTVTTTDTSSNSSNQPGPSLTEEQIVKIVERREQQRQQAQNVESCMAEVRKVYGTKADEFLSDLAKDIGQTVDQLKALAGSSPAAFQRIANLKNNNSQGTPGVSSSVNSQAATSSTNSDGSVRNKAYYDAKMKEVGAKKFAFDSALQKQMHQDMIRLGDNWET